MKTILISGGAGYLGTELTKSLLKDYKVIVYDRFNFPWIIKNLKKIKNYKRLKIIKKDIKEVSVDDFYDVDCVCDLNGIPNDPASELNPKKTWEINYRARYNFAKKAKRAKVRRYIFNSTCSVFGHNKKTVYENSIKQPISTYAKANLMAEKKIFKLRNRNFKMNILRNSTLYGFSNSMRLDLVINIYIYKIMNNQKIIVAYSMFNDVFDGHKAEFTIKNGSNISMDDVLVIVGDTYGNEIEMYYNDVNLDIDNNYSFNINSVYPNPFNPSTDIDFTLPLDSYIKLSVYNIKGQEVDVVFEGYQDSGQHSYTWNASGSASRIYYFHLFDGNTISTAKAMSV